MCSPVRASWADLTAYSAWEQSYSEFMKAHGGCEEPRRAGNLSPSGHADLARMQAYADYCRDHESRVRQAFSNS